MNNLPKTVTRQRRSCDLNPGPSAPESSTLTTRLGQHIFARAQIPILGSVIYSALNQMKTEKTEQVMKKQKMICSENSKDLKIILFCRTSHCVLLTT